MRKHLLGFGLAAVFSGCGVLGDGQNGSTPDAGNADPSKVIGYIATQDNRDGAGTRLSAAFVERQFAGELSGHIPNGLCMQTTDYQLTGPSSSGSGWPHGTASVGQSVTFAIGGTSYQAPRESNSVGQLYNALVGDHLSGTATVSFLGDATQGTLGKAFTSALLTLPEEIQLSPATIPVTRGRPFTISWTGQGGDLVVITMHVKTATDVVACGVRDTGSFEVPASVWDALYGYGTMEVRVSRKRISYAPYPLSQGVYTVAGITDHVSQVGALTVK